MTLPDAVEADVDRYLDREPDATVGQVLGRFCLDPEKHAAAVAERLGEGDGQRGDSAADHAQPTLTEVAQ